jgi:hypothetical protein
MWMVFVGFVDDPDNAPDIRVLNLMRISAGVETRQTGFFTNPVVLFAAPL